MQKKAQTQAQTQTRTQTETLTQTQMANANADEHADETADGEDDDTQLSDGEVISIVNNAGYIKGLSANGIKELLSGQLTGTEIDSVPFEKVELGSTRIPFANLAITCKSAIFKSGLVGVSIHIIFVLSVIEDSKVSGLL